MSSTGAVFATYTDFQHGIGDFRFANVKDFRVVVVVVVVVVVIVIVAIVAISTINCQLVQLLQRDLQREDLTGCRRMCINGQRAPSKQPSQTQKQTPTAKIAVSSNSNSRIQACFRACG